MDCFIFLDKCTNFGSGEGYQSIKTCDVVQINLHHIWLLLDNISPVPNMENPDLVVVELLSPLSAVAPPCGGGFPDNGGGLDDDVSPAATPANISLPDNVCKC